MVEFAEQQVNRIEAVEGAIKHFPIVWPFERFCEMDVHSVLQKDLEGALIEVLQDYLLEELRNWLFKVVRLSKQINYLIEDTLG